MAIALLPGLTQELNIEYTGPDLTTAGIKAIVERFVPYNFKFKKELIDDEVLKILVAKNWLYGPPNPLTGKNEKPESADKVRFISLDNSKVTDEGVKSILKCTNLESIGLTGTKITDAALLSLRQLSKLNRIALPGEQITNKGLDALAELPALKEITIKKGQLTEDQIASLAKFKNLKKISIENAKVDKEWVKKHLSAFPMQSDKYGTLELTR